MTRVGVTGATGLIGSALVDHLAQQPGIQVVALRRTASRAESSSDPDVEWREGDLGSIYDAASFVDGLDGVIHLAHRGSPLTSGRDLPSDAASNMLPTLTLLQALRERTEPCHVVFASSGGALYAGLPPGGVATEASPVAPTTSYAIQKLATEHYLRVAAEEGWLTATTLRIGNAYGSVLPSDRLQGFIGVAVSRLAAGKPIRLIGDTANVRDYVHLRDLCEAIALALDARAGFQLFNIGSGRGTSIDELLALLTTVSGISPRIERLGGLGAASRLPRWVVLDASKAGLELGWQATVPLRQGIEELWSSARR